MVKESSKEIVAGRSIKEILGRFKNKINDPRKPSKGKKVSKIIKDFLKINCKIELAAAKLNHFFKKNQINLRVEKNYFPISKNKISKLNVKFFVVSKF